MRTRRLTGLGLGMMATVALGVAGCTTGDTPAGPSAPESPPAPASSGVADPNAAAALSSATAALGSTPVKLTMTSGPGAKLTASIDPPGGKGTATLAITGQNVNIAVKTLLVAQDLYVQVPGITKAGTWTHVDVSRLPEGANVGLRPGQIDPVNTAKVLTSTTDVQQVDARSFKGTLDLTKVAGITGVDKATVDGFGAAAQKVPFTAGLDDQGRLSVLTIALPAVNGKPSQPLEVLYTEYGTPVTAERPAATTITEAPDKLYTSLGG